MAPDSDEVIDAEPVGDDPARQFMQRFEILEAKLHRGPLPSPEALQDYENVLPGCAERIVSQWEGQSGHRQDLEKSMVSANIKSRFIAQGISFLVVLIGIVAGTILILEDKDAAGLAAILTPLGVIAIRLLRNGNGGGSSSDPDDREQGREATPAE